MRVVVVGATGNVGTSLVAALAADPAVTSILGMARRRPAWNPPKTEWVPSDIVRSDLEQHFRGADAVVHLAWLFQPTHDPVLTWENNVGGSMRVFRAAATAGVPALVYASSVGAYSPGPGDRQVDERWPTDGWPTSSYTREKAYLERVLDVIERDHPDMRVVRMRPGFIFKRESAIAQRRLFAGPLLPHRLLRPGRVPVLPDMPGLRFQALHSDDAANAYRLAIVRPVRGAFNLAADPTVDGAGLARLLGARRLRVPVPPVRAGLAAAWRMHLVPASPDLFDAVLRIPIMSTGRAREELGWQPRHSGLDAVAEFLEGLRTGTGMDTPPLSPATSRRGRTHEFATGVGSRP
jgi:nucleoside-diphosphate-sugar epimerase